MSSQYEWSDSEEFLSEFETEDNERTGERLEDQESEEDSPSTASKSTQAVSKKKPYTMSSLVGMRIMRRDASEAKTYYHPRPRQERGLGPSLWRAERIGANLEIHPGQLCEFCSNLNLEDLHTAAQSDRKFAGHQGHHRTPQRLEAAAVRCPLCRLFYREMADSWDRLLKTTSPEPIAPNWGQCRFKIWVWNGDYQNRIPVQDRPRYLVLEWCGRGVDAVAEVLLTSRVGTAASDKGRIVNDTSAPLIEGIASNKSWNIIFKLWNKCMLRHPDCRFRQETWGGGRPSNNALYREVPLPTRVVVVDADHPYLLETKGALGIYAALSHCWGETHNVKTTRKNITEHMKRIRFSPVFRTFYDAILTCKMLNIPYIWIDSLCIIQHDPADPLSNRDDFDREGKLMGQIYGRASLTIAATGASDEPTMGLFRGERHRFRQLVELPFRYRRNDEPDGFMYASLKPKNFAQEISDSRLFTRGWVLQERLLSPRYLHFGREQWFWQCREMTVAESDGIGGSINVNIGADLGMVQAIKGERLKFSNWWTQIVEIYTKLDFTIPSDKKIALRGLMEEIKRVSNREHAWGLWTESLHLQLMWYAAPESEEDEGYGTQISTPQPQQSFRSFTWSWLSCNHPVSFPTPARQSGFRQSGLYIGYPGGTTQKLAFQSVFHRPQRANPANANTATPTLSGLDISPRNLWNEGLFIRCLLKNILVSLIPEKPGSRRRAQPSERLGPLAAALFQQFDDGSRFKYRLLPEDFSSEPGANEDEMKIGYATIDDVTAVFRPNLSTSINQSANASQPAWPVSVACFIVSSNTVTEDGQDWRQNPSGGQEDSEVVGQVISHNVMLLQMLSRNVYQRIGTGVILKAHVGFFADVAQSSFLLR